MFTGIVETMGKVLSVKPMDTSSSGGSGFAVVIGEAQVVLSDVALGDSIAINGTCLTVTEFNTERTQFKVGISPETLRKTCLGELKEGSLVNLERAMSATTRFGGHVVQGHVDGTVTILSITPDPPNSLIFKFKVPEPVTPTSHDLLSLIVPKGYVCLDGVSLTVIDVDWESRTFTIMMIAYTQEKVALAKKKQGDLVNLEVDAMGKHVESIVRSMLTGSKEIHGMLENMMQRMISKSLADKNL